MEFANNWDFSPWPSLMYEPVLKLKMRDRVGRGPEAPDDASSFMIKYDPSIMAGRYSRPPTPKEIAMRRTVGRPGKSEAQIEEAVNAPTAYDSPQEKNILGGVADNNTFAASKTAIGRVMRIKADRRDGVNDSKTFTALESFDYTLKALKASNTPIISEYPEDFLLYAYRNYILMPSIARDQGWESRYKDVRCIEMCLHSVVLTQVFKLRLQDYPEVEPHWHCLASTEVSA